LSGRSEERVFLGLGGNLGDPARAMAEALRRLDASPGVAVRQVSSLYRTPPWGKTDQPDFLNAVAGLGVGIEPRTLLELCLDTERQLKRVRHERWGPRPIDLDILLFGERTVGEPDLAVPHPRLAERAFVLVPLAEIAPDLVIRGRSIGELLAQVDTGGIERIDSDGEWWRSG
jgi:2-amino-4-hydroxy-6-hydroxymethyldihydropteridine diphosphokinase